MTEYKFDDSENEFDESKENKKPDIKLELTELPITLTLITPIEFGSQTKAHIIFRNPLTVKMMEHLPVELSNAKLGQYVPVIASMTGETLEFIRKLSFADYTSALNIVSRFLGSGQ